MDLDNPSEGPPFQDARSDLLQYSSDIPGTPYLNRLHATLISESSSGDSLVTWGSILYGTGLGLTDRGAGARK